jgi:hypothetical protein
MREAAMYAMNSKDEEVCRVIGNCAENRVTWNIGHHKRLHFKTSASNAGSDGCYSLKSGISCNAWSGGTQLSHYCRI